MHLDTHRDLNCSNCEEVFILPQQREKHQRDDCKNRKVSCPLEFLGCSNAVSIICPHSFIFTNCHLVSERYSCTLFYFLDSLQ
jgi:hypothetical protein